MLSKKYITFFDCVTEHKFNRIPTLMDCIALVYQTGSLGKQIPKSVNLVDYYKNIKSNKSSIIESIHDWLKYCSEEFPETLAHKIYTTYEEKINNVKQ